MSESKVVSIVLPVAKALAQELGLEIWDIKLAKEGPHQYLRVFIDKPGLVTIEDCENMSRALDEPLDELDPIEDSYSLEVCSPGIERELTKDWHFEKFISHEVKLRLIRPDENSEKEILGLLKSFDKHAIVIENSEKFEVRTDRKNISHINLVYKEGNLQ